MNETLKEKIEDYKKFHDYAKYYPLEIFIQKPLSPEQGAVLALIVACLAQMHLIFKI